MDSRRIILILKGLALTALLGVWLEVDMPIWLGEKEGFSEQPSSAADASASAETNAEAGGIDVPEVGDEAAESSAKKPTKSLIDELLYLPKLDRERLTKGQLARYLDMLDRRKIQVEAKISSLKAEHKRLAGLERDVAGKIDKLQEELKFFQQTVQKEKSFGEERLAKLVAFYQKVPPKKSAPVFESLDKDLVVSLFNGLPQKQVTKILALMNPQKSVEITEYYGRVKSAKEYLLLKEINKELQDSFKKCSELSPSP